MSKNSSSNPTTKPCPGHNGWCGRPIKMADWKAGIHRCASCRNERTAEKKRSGEK